MKPNIKIYEPVMNAKIPQMRISSELMAAMNKAIKTFSSPTGSNTGFSLSRPTFIKLAIERLADDINSGRLNEIEIGARISLKLKAVQEKS